ncbi:MAG: hypothetical protein COA83_10210 [Methylophaga sp.]|nr:MAG: hypothetical protein COA83_10210 [Methylophaga sp.]
MKKNLISALLTGACLLFSATASFAECTYKPEKEGFNMSFTAYGAPEKNYIVKGNKFKEYTLASESGLLKGASIEIDATSLDTSFTKDNGLGAEWPAMFLTLRDSNVVGYFFNKFKTDPAKINATISAINEDSLDLDVTMNGVTKTIAMSFTVEEGKLMAAGKLEILDFAPKAFKSLRDVCEAGFHQGKSWSDIDLKFDVPVEKNCN